MGMVESLLVHELRLVPAKRRVRLRLTCSGDRGGVRPFGARATLGPAPPHQHPTSHLEAASPRREDSICVFVQGRVFMHQFPCGSYPLC